jgi:hypothetical protein
MVCLYCGGRLPLLRNLELGEFCSAAHREQFERLQHEFREGDPGETPAEGSLKPLPALIFPQDQQLERRIPIDERLPQALLAVPREASIVETREPRVGEKLNPTPVTAEPGYIGTLTHPEPCTAVAGLPHSAPSFGDIALAGPGRNARKPLPLRPVSFRFTLPAPLSRPSMVRPTPEAVLAPMQVQIAGSMADFRPAAIPVVLSPRPKVFLGGASRRIGWRSVALAASVAVLVFMVAHGWQPVKAAEKLPGKSSWARMRKDISNRAAIDMVDDFRAGLDSWTSRHSNMGWSYDQVGFIRPASLAVYDPSLKLTDYSFEFLGQLKNKGMGVAVRAADLDNYYAVRIAVVHPGPLPILEVVRYPVIGGREGKHVSKPLPLTIRPDSLFRARILADGDEFTLMVQDQIVDFWSDARFRTGGVGFFCLRGDDARLRWVEITHHDDTLGRLCALIAPYGVGAANGSWEK